MKAIVINGFGGIENFELKEVENPLVKAGEVLIKIKATTFNPIDYQMRRGSTESKLLKSPILGREFSGEVLEIGKNVNRVAIGDRVTAYVGSLASNGTFAELISVPQELIAKNPESLSYEQAAALPMVGMTALQCFNRLKVPKDKTIFISGGAGGVGTILIKLLLANGNQQVYATAGNTESINHLIRLGLDEHHIINYRSEDVATVMKSKIKDGTLGYIIDLVGGHISEICAELIAVYGTYVDVTFLATEKAREMLFDKATTIMNVANYAESLKKGNHLSYYGNALKQLFNLIDSKKISPTAIHIVGDLSVETVSRAHQLMEDNLTKGKKLIMSI